MYDVSAGCVVHNVVVGIDESGIGAWSGPFHIGVVVADVMLFNRQIGRYLRDSKKLSDQKRRKATPMIKEYAIATAVAEVPVNKINQGWKDAWRAGVLWALEKVQPRLSKLRYNLIIDGTEDDTLMQWLSHRKYNEPNFIVNADDRFPAVMAASIIAKTARNDAMIALSHEYPEFNWQQNAGYGTPQHRKACDEYGITPHHRKVRRLRGCKAYEPKAAWFGDS